MNLKLLNAVILLALFVLLSPRASAAPDKYIYVGQGRYFCSGDCGEHNARQARQDQREAREQERRDSDRIREDNRRQRAERRERE